MARVTTNIFYNQDRTYTVSKISSSSLQLKLVTSAPGFPLPSGLTKLGNRSVAVISHYPPATLNYELTIYVSWFTEDGPTLATGSYGNFTKILSDSTSKLCVGSEGIFPIPVIISSSTSKLCVSSIGDIWIDSTKKNWVKWSNIGSSDFTIGKDNIAGARPLDWKGWVYSIKKLGSKVIAYGENGVSVLIPLDNTYGMQTIYRIGIKGRQAVAGDHSIHFFIDKIGQLFSLGELTRKSSLFEETTYPEKLGYSEYLSVMTDPVLSWDSLNNLLYICDGAYGYIYSSKDKSLGKGPINVTGISYQGGSLYVAASATIVTPTFEVCTDIFDLGSRKTKVIKHVEVGTDLIGPLRGAIEFRIDKGGEFISTPWTYVNPNGVFYLPCFGIEFKFKLSLLSYESFEIDYIRISGNFHNFSYIDTSLSK